MRTVERRVLTGLAVRVFILIAAAALFGTQGCSSSSGGGDAAGGGSGGGASGMGGEGGESNADGSAVLSCPWALTPCERCDGGRSCCGDFCCHPGEWCDTSGATPRCRCGMGESCSVPPVVGPCSPMRSNPDPCVRYCCSGDC